MAASIAGAAIPAPFGLPSMPQVLTQFIGPILSVGVVLSTNKVVNALIGGAAGSGAGSTALGIDRHWRQPDCRRRPGPCHRGCDWRGGTRGGKRRPDRGRQGQFHSPRRTRQVRRERVSRNRRFHPFERQPGLRQHLAEADRSGAVPDGAAPGWRPGRQDCRGPHRAGRADCHQSGHR